MQLTVIGISHHTAPVEVRETVSLPAELRPRVLSALMSETAVEEALLLDTCNRTELYCVTEGEGELLPRLLNAIAEQKRSEVDIDPACFYRHDDLAAARHLFRVAAALDSQLIGDQEILGQVKKAYRTAVSADTNGRVLNHLLHAAFRVGKRVRTETELDRGTASVPLAAVAIAREILGSLEGRTVLLIGAGKTAELAAEALIGYGGSHLIVANRTVSRGRELLNRVLEGRNYADLLNRKREERTIRCPALLARRGLDAPPEPDAPSVPVRTGEAIPLAKIGEFLDKVDLIISSTGAGDFILSSQTHGPRLRSRASGLVVIDIAVPRDIDPRLAEHENLFLYSLDDLDRLVDENIERRRSEVPRAEAIVEEEVAQFAGWLESLQVVPTIKLLKERFAELQAAEADRFSRKVDGAEDAELQEFARSLCNKILHEPITFLHEISSTRPPSEVQAVVRLIREMFGLDVGKPD